MPTVRLIIEIDRETRNDFRSKCIKVDTTMKDVLTDFIKSFDPKKVKKKMGIKL